MITRKMAIKASNIYDKLEQTFMPRMKVVFLGWHKQFI